MTRGLMELLDSFVDEFDTSNKTDVTSSISSRNFLLPELLFCYRHGVFHYWPVYTWWGQYCFARWRLSSSVVCRRL